MYIFSNPIAALSEGGRVAQEVIGDGIAGELSIKTNIAGGVSAGSPLPLGSEKQRAARLQEMFSPQPTPVVAQGVFKIRGTRNNIVRTAPKLRPTSCKSHMGNEILQITTAVREVLTETRYLRDPDDTSKNVVDNVPVHGDAGLVDHSRRNYLRQLNLSQGIERLEDVVVSRKR